MRRSSSWLQNGCLTAMPVLRLGIHPEVERPATLNRCVEIVEEKCNAKEAEKGPSCTPSSEALRYSQTSAVSCAHERTPSFPD